KIFRVPKPQLVILPQVATLSWTEFTHPLSVIQPAHTFGLAAAEYLLTESDVVVGSSRFLEVLRIAGTPPTLSSLGKVEVSPYPIIPTSLPVAPQTQIDTGDTRILNVVYRNGNLYATHTVSNSANTKTEVAWYEVVPSSPPTLAQQGRVSHASRFYYYPSIAVNVNGDIALGFSGSSSTEFAGGYYTARLNSDPIGSTQPVALLQAGLASYFKTFGGTSNRWGDFSATVVDPTDDFTFWTLQEYARTGNQWGTWWGSFRITDIIAPDNVVTTLLDNLTVRLTWNDRATNDLAYVVERKTGAGGTFVVLTSPPLPANSTSYTDNTGLASGTEYFYRVGAVSANSTAYSSEVQVVTPAPPSSGGGGGCLSITRSGGEAPFGTSLFSVGILLLPACAIGLRRFFTPAGASRPGPAPPLLRKVKTRWRGR
ncbi:MAG: fibronectin type III domain-containing protein, partial [bacterium]|nr:fibronectin type III domain-containing protein [bacterium]